jgi:transposase
MSKENESKPRKYTEEYKVEAVKLVREIGNRQASRELGIPPSTLFQWVQAAKRGLMDTGVGTNTPAGAMTMAEEIQKLRAEIKAQAKEIARIKKENAFLEEASAFFAASRQKSVKEKE